MFFSTLTLKYDSDTGQIDDTPFQEFSRDKEVLSVKAAVGESHESVDGQRLPDPFRSISPVPVRSEGAGTVHG